MKFLLYGYFPIADRYKFDTIEISKVICNRTLDRLSGITMSMDHLIIFCTGFFLKILLQQAFKSIEQKNKSAGGIEQAM